jgi:hypothetical protein
MHKVIKMEENNTIQLFPPNPQGLFIVNNHPIVVALRKNERKLETTKIWRNGNIEHIKKYAKQYRQKNKDKIKISELRWRNSEKGKILKKLYNLKRRRKPEYLAYQRAYFQKPEVIARNYPQTEKRKAWEQEYYKTQKYKEYIANRAKNPQRKEYAKNYVKNRFASDIQFHTYVCLRGALNKAMKEYGIGKKVKSRELGINYEKIHQHLGSPPQDGKKYHIDHIKPCCSFDFSNKEQVKSAFAPENLRWLPEKENWKKMVEDKKLSIHKHKRRY